MSVPHITICICTCGRPALLERLLRDAFAAEINAPANSGMIGPAG